jgi:protein-disulfide isomerase
LRVARGAARSSLATAGESEFDLSFHHGIFIMAETSTTQSLGAGPPKMMLIPPVNERDHAQGSAIVAITLVEYGDYHSRECAAAQPWIEALQARMGDRLRLVFRHFPAFGVRPLAAEAAEAAGLQGRFWQMHKLLFEHQSALGNGYLVEYARDLKLDTGQFLRDMAGHVCAERVRSDLASGAESGVQKTPVFFVNGARQPSSWKGDLAAMPTIPRTETGRRADVSGAEESDKQESDEQESDE